MDAFIFLFGLLVTVVAVGAVGTIWWAAIRDGQTDAALRRGEQTDLDAAPPLVAPETTVAEPEAVA